MKKVKNDLAIGVFDSGLGGLCVLKDLAEFLPLENFMYYGDNENAPYGNKDIETLKSLSLGAVNRLLDEGVKAIVIGCNTLSSHLYKYIRDCAGVPVIKTLPPKSNNKNDILICTQKTAESSYVLNGFKGLVIPSKTLAIDIEKNIFNLSKIDLKNITELIPLTTDKVVLGCTHYHYVKSMLELLTNVKVIDGYSKVKFDLYDTLKKHKLFTFRNNGEIKFIGASSSFNGKVYYEILKKQS